MFRRFQINVTFFNRKTDLRFSAKWQKEEKHLEVPRQLIKIDNQLFTILPGNVITAVIKCYTERPIEEIIMSDCK